MGKPKHAVYYTSTFDGVVIDIVGNLSSHNYFKNPRPWRITFGCMLSRVKKWRDYGVELFVGVITLFRRRADQFGGVFGCGGVVAVELAPPQRHSLMRFKLFVITGSKCGESLSLSPFQQHLMPVGRKKKHTSARFSQRKNFNKPPFVTQPLLNSHDQPAAQS